MQSARQPNQVILQERDVAVLRGFFECRLMTQFHAASLFFQGRAESAKKRLQKLKAAGYLVERPRSPFEPAVLHLTRKGLLALRDRGILAEYPVFTMPALERRAKVSPLSLAHELAVMDVKVAMCAAIDAEPSLSVAEFNTWPRLNEFEALGDTQRPDGFVRVREREPDGGLSEHCFFLEVDRSTEPLELLSKKAARYREHYQGGGFAERMGGRRADVERFPFRVLFVLRSEERRNNAAEALLRLNPPVLAQAYLTTIGELRKDPLGEVWIRPVDYRDALAGTSFNEGPFRGKTQYTRQAAKNDHVRANVMYVALIND